jgi:hypothetical protein
MTQNCFEFIDSDDQPICGYHHTQLIKQPIPSQIQGPTRIMLVCPDSGVELRRLS